MKTQQSKIIRKYKRQSKSKWQQLDDSTILLLATFEDKESLSLKYDRYIYLHRDEVGRWLGISISRMIQDSLDLGDKYLCGADMFSVLLRYKNEILDFLEFFSDEFESLFGLDPLTYLAAAEICWQSKLSRVF